jgi:signal transduction histidine kinase
MLAARRRSEEELRGMAQRLVTLQDKERRDIARELHDRVGQNLAALSINLARLGGGRGAGAERRAHIAECASLVEQTGMIVQNVLTELKPPMLASYGLLDALRVHARDFSRRTGIEVAVAGGDDGARLPPDVEMALFRIAQAALNNTAQHARAKQVRVFLERVEGRVKFEIRDDGVGFDVERALASGRLGLTAIRERAEAIGGSLRIESSAGSGARIIVEVATA